MKIGFSQNGPEGVKMHGLTFWEIFISSKAKIGRLKAPLEKACSSHGTLEN